MNIIDIKFRNMTPEQILTYATERAESAIAVLDKLEQQEERKAKNKKQNELFQKNSSAAIPKY